MFTMRRIVFTLAVVFAAVTTVGVVAADDPDSFVYTNNSSDVTKKINISTGDTQWSVTNESFLGVAAYVEKTDTTVVVQNNGSSQGPRATFLGEDGTAIGTVNIGSGNVPYFVDVHNESGDVFISFGRSGGGDNASLIRVNSSTANVEWNRSINGSDSPGISAAGMTFITSDRFYGASSSATIWSVNLSAGDYRSHNLGGSNATRMRVTASDELYTHANDKIYQYFPSNGTLGDGFTVDNRFDGGSTLRARPFHATGNVLLAIESSGGGGTGISAEGVNITAVHTNGTELYELQGVGADYAIAETKNGYFTTELKIYNALTGERIYENTTLPDAPSTILEPGPPGVFSDVDPYVEPSTQDTNDTDNTTESPPAGGTTGGDGFFGLGTTFGVPNSAFLGLGLVLLGIAGYVYYREEYNNEVQYSD